MQSASLAQSLVCAFGHDAYTQPAFDHSAHGTQAVDLDALAADTPEMTLEDFAERTRLVLDDGPYDTVAGYVMAQLGALPRLGDEVSVVLVPEGDADGQPVRFTLAVTQMDGRRAAWFALGRAALPEAVPDV